MLTATGARAHEGLLRRLERHAGVALRRARSSGRGVIASAGAPWPFAGGDPVAIAAASRAPGEPWFCFEQPDRGASALAALGCVRELATGGTDESRDIGDFHPADGRDQRFCALAARWRELAAGAVADDPDGPPGSGLACFGGFAFAPDGACTAAWEGFDAASLIVPEVSLVRGDGRLWVTVNLEASPDDTVGELLERARRRLAGLRQAPLPLLDPAPAGRFRVDSPIPPVHFEEAVARAVQRIGAGELDKVVLAREVEVQAPRAHDPAAILGVLREAFPACFVYAVGRGEATFLGASPELLVRREGSRASTVALAGSIRRSADPAVDDHLGERLLRSDKDREENAIVARRIARSLRPHAVWVTAPAEPTVVKVANIQHLARPIRAQLAEPLSALELAGLLHPTPAVGAEPREAGLALIPALEGLDRGWYAGALGWSDATGDGELCVALRCALLRGRLGRCYAGCGIVRDSEPAAELAETEVKLAALLPLLAG
jgi:isochorismate synthase